MSAKTATGIDIGSHCIKVVQLRKAGDRVELVKAGCIDCLATSNGADAPDSAAAAARLRELLRSLHCHARSANTAVGGKRVVIRYTHTPFVPAWQLRMMMEYQIKGDSMGGEQKNAADYRPLNIPTSKDLRLMIGLARNEAVLEQMAVLRHAGVKARDVTLSALPPAATLAHGIAEADDEPVTCLVNIGAENTDLVVQRGRNVYFARNITTGSKAFTEALSSRFDLDFEQAERMKVEQGFIRPEAPTAAAPGSIALEGEEQSTPVLQAELSDEEQRIADALRRPANGLAAQIQVSMSACRSAIGQPRLRVDKLLLSGGGARLQGLPEFLASRLHMPVETLNCLAGIDCSAVPPNLRAELQQSQSHYAVAVGLALGQLQPGTFHLSLLPQEIKQRRDFFSRRIYLWAAGGLYAATLLLAIVSSHFVTSLRAQRVDELKQIVAAAETEENEVKLLGAQNALQNSEVSATARRLHGARHALQLFSLMRRLTPPHVEVGRVETYTGRDSPLERPPRPLSHLEKLAKKGKPPPPRVIVITGKVTLDAVRGDRLYRKIDLVTAQRRVEQYGKELEKQFHLVEKLEIPVVPSEVNKEFRIELKLKAGTL